jgi:hypothetical protein
MYRPFYRNRTSDPSALQKDWSLCAEQNTDWTEAGTNLHFALRPPEEAGDRFQKIDSVDNRRAHLEALHWKLKSRQQHLDHVIRFAAVKPFDTDSVAIRKPIASVGDVDLLKFQSTEPNDVRLRLSNGVMRSRGETAEAGHEGKGRWVVSQSSGKGALDREGNCGALGYIDRTVIAHEDGSTKLSRKSERGEVSQHGSSQEVCSTNEGVDLCHVDATEGEAASTTAASRAVLNGPIGGQSSSHAAVVAKACASRTGDADTIPKGNSFKVSYLGS